MANDGMMFSIAPPREEVERDFRRNEMNTLGDAAQQRFGNGAFWGAALANGIGGQMRPGLPPEIESRVSAQEAANKRISEMAPDVWAKMDPGVKSRVYRKILGEEAYKHGLQDLGSQLFTQVDAESQAFAKQQAELEKAGAEAKKDQVITEAAQFALTRNKLEAVRGKSATVYPLGTSNENSGVSGFIDDNGDFHAGGKTIASGNYTLDRPNAPTKSGSGGGMGNARDYYTPTEQRGMRGMQRDVMSQMRASMRIQDILNTAFTQGGSVDILGGAGKASSLVTKVVDEVSAMGRAIQKAGGSYSRNVMVTDSEGNGMYRLDGSEAAAEKAADYMADIEFNLPASVRNDETQARRYKAAMINLAYAIARAEEPGNPRLSDDDFKRNLSQIADNTTSPETLRQVIKDRLNTSVSEYDMMVKQVHPKFRDEIFTKDANDAYNKQYSEYLEAYSKPFGTAGNPGPGVTEEEEEIPGLNDLGDNFYWRMKPQR